jgi:hypothetical protein
VGCGFSVVCCGLSVGIRLLTVAFWVGDAVDFSVVGCGFSVVCCELWVVGSRLGFDCLQWLSKLEMMWTYGFRL